MGKIKTKFTKILFLGLLTIIGLTFFAKEAGITKAIEADIEVPLGEKSVNSEEYSSGGILGDYDVSAGEQSGKLDALGMSTDSSAYTTNNEDGLSDSDLDVLNENAAGEAAQSFEDSETSNGIIEVEENRIVCYCELPKSNDVAQTNTSSLQPKLLKAQAGANSECEVICRNFFKRQQPSLHLSPSSAPTGVPSFSESYILEKWQNNDKLIENLVNESLIYRIVRIAKYVLGGVFMIYFGLYVINFLHATDKEQAVTKFKDQMLWSFAGFIVLALAEPFSEAFSLMGLGDSTGSIITDATILQQSANVVSFTYRSAAHLIQYLLGGISLVTMGISAFRIINAVGDEETVKNARKAITWAALGLVIAGASSLLIDKVFAPEEATLVISQDFYALTEKYKSDPKFTAALNNAVGKNDPLTQHEIILLLGKARAKVTILAYVKYFQTFVGAAAVLMLFLAGFKMVSAGGQEEILTKQRKMIAWIFMGLAVIMISETFVNIFLPTDDVGRVIFENNTAVQSFSKEIGGFTNFVLTFSSSIAVLALIVGALYVTTAVANPEQAEKGKKIVLASALGLVVTISAYALVNTVLSQNPDGNVEENKIEISF